MLNNHMWMMAAILNWTGIEKYWGLIWLFFPYGSLYPNELF